MRFLEDWRNVWGLLISSGYAMFFCWGCILFKFSFMLLTHFTGRFLQTWGEVVQRKWPCNFIWYQFNLILPTFFPLLTSIATPFYQHWTYHKIEMSYNLIRTHFLIFHSWLAPAQRNNKIHRIFSQRIIKKTTKSNKIV